jgi:hypothetical protein
MNGTEDKQRFRIAVEGLEGATLADSPEVVLEPTEARWVPLAVQLPPDSARTLGAGAHPMRFRFSLLAPPQPGAVPADASPLAERLEKSTFVVPR